MPRHVLLVLLAAAAAAAEPQRGLVVACAADADPAITAAAGRILAAAATSPLLRALADGHPAAPLADSRTLAAGRREELAWRHVVVVGLPDDPLVAQAWQHEARIADGGIEAFGFGVLRGAVGWNEAGPNPWLHSAAIARPPYESEAVVVSGTTPAAVALAADALLGSGLVNGAVAAPSWQRPETTLLDRDPVAPGEAPPEWLAGRTGGWTRIALSWCGADVARGILADAGTEPAACWLAKYHRPGVWDRAGAEGAFANFATGLHRRAFCNAVLLARFADASAATAAAVKVAAAARLGGRQGVFRGSLKGFQDDRTPAGPLACWSRGAWLVLSSLPADADPAREDP